MQDEAFVICDTSMVTAVKTVAQLPLMTMMAILCPKGAEATLYSTFTGIMNLGQVNTSFIYIPCSSCSSV